MVSKKNNAAFIRDKGQLLSFFTENAALSKEEQFQKIKDRAQTMGYGFILDHKKAIEFEYAQTDPHEEISSLFHKYYASLLEIDREAYSQNEQDNEEKKPKTEEQKKKEEDFIHFLYDSFVDFFKKILSAPFHISRIREYEVYLNIARLSWVFSRLTVIEGLNTFRDFIAQLDVFFGMHTDIDKVIALIQTPTFIVNCCSVGFFLLRFGIDASLLLKHTFFPTELEKGLNNSSELHWMERLPTTEQLDEYRNSYIFIEDEEDIKLYYIPRKGLSQKLNITNKNKLKQDLINKQLIKNQFIRLSTEDFRAIISAETKHQPQVTTWFDRLIYELYKRHCNYSNDLVWALINFLTNFNYISKIPDPITGYLTGTFLFFDVCMTLYKRNLAKEEYLSKKAQYLQEIKDYEDLNKFTYLTQAQRLKRLEQLRNQLTKHELSWQVTESTFNFAAVGAVLFMLGFTASLFVTPGVLVIGCYFVCVLAGAIYRSCDAYSAYKEKSLLLEQAQLTGTNIPVSLKEYEIARNDFLYTLTRNALIPPLLIATYAVCWPAAIALTVMFLGYELYHAYDQFSAKKEAKQVVVSECENSYSLP